MTRLFIRLQNNVIRHLCRQQHGKRCVYSGINHRSFHLASSMNGKILPFKLSDIGEGIKEVEVKEWFVEMADSVAQFDDICEVQSDKASVVITSRFDGVIRKLYYQVGDVAQVGDPLVDIEVEGEEEGSVEAPSEEVKKEATTTQVSAPTTPTPSAPISTPSSPAVMSSSKVLATPAVRHLAKLNNINIADVSGSGENGRVLKEDIDMMLAGKQAPQAPVITAPPPALVEDRTERVKGIRKAMWTSMTASLQIPHFGYDDEYDMSKLVQVREQLKHESKRMIGSKISFMPFILKACSMALSEYPILNSHIDVQNDSIIYKADHNIGVAVDTEHGLLLPCIKGIQNMSILDIAVELNRLQHAGMKNKLAPQDLTGGTFSLSNIGSIGGTYARPVIFPPQVAIGAIGKIQKLPRFDRNGEIKESRIMCASWSADHRVIEGATMARFSNKLKDYLENPESMLLHLK